MLVCVRACVRLRACVSTCERACILACVRVCVFVRAYVRVYDYALLCVAYTMTCSMQPLCNLMTTDISRTFIQLNNC